MTEREGWATEPNILSAERLDKIRAVLAQTFLIVEHRFYQQASAPRCAVFHEFERFEAYIKEHAKPGDSIWCWNYQELCRDDNPVTHGKLPDADGRVPIGGAY